MLCFEKEQVVKLEVIAMRKSFFIMIAMLSVIYLNAQVKSFNVISSKTYVNNTKTSYISLNANIDNETALIIEKEIEEHPDISKFSFYAKPIFTKCMFTTNTSLDEQMVIDLINDVINNYFDDNIKQTFGNSSFINGYYKVEFRINESLNSETVKEIQLKFKNNELIYDVNYLGNSKFEIFTIIEIFPNDIKAMLDEWKMDINPEDIK